MSHEAAPQQAGASRASQQWHVLWSHKHLLALGVALGVLGGLAMLYLGGPRYSATADVLVRTTSATPFEPTDATRQVSMQTEVQVAGSEKVAALVVQQVGADEDPADLASGLRVTNPPDTAVLRFRYSADSPAQAQRLANEFAKGYLADRESRTLNTVDRLVKILQDEQATLTDRRALLDSLIQRRANPSERAALEAQRKLVLDEVLEIRNRLVAARTLDTTPGDVVQTATAPSRPDGPSLWSIVLLGALVGLALGGALVWLATQSGGRGPRNADVERSLQACVLARLPRGELVRPRRGRRPVLPRVSEEGRALAVALTYGGGPGGARSLLIAEPRGVGVAQQVTVELALALADMGRSVSLVEADLRSPGLLERLPVTEGFSTEPLSGPDGLPAGPSRWPVGQVYGIAGQERMVLYPGQPDPAAVETLTRPEVEQFLKGVSSRTDFVLVLAPPLLQAVDGLELVHLLDGVLLTVGGGQVAASDLELTRDAVRGAGGRLIGAVTVGQ